jgi:hypothetical protein
MNTEVDKDKDWVDKMTDWIDKHPLKTILLVVLFAVLCSIPIYWGYCYVEDQNELVRMEIEHDIKSGYKVSLDGVYMDADAIEDLDVFLDNTEYLGADDVNACLKFKHTDRSK